PHGMFSSAPGGWSGSRNRLAGSHARTSRHRDEANGQDLLLGALLCRGREPAVPRCELSICRRETAMAEIALHFEADKDADLDQAAESIRKQLSALEAVGDVDADPEKPRLTGLE